MKVLHLEMKMGSLTLFLYINFSLTVLYNPPVHLPLE